MTGRTQKRIAQDVPSEDIGGMSDTRTGAFTLIEMSIDDPESLTVTETEKLTEIMGGREKDLVSEAPPRGLIETNTGRTVITVTRAMKAATVGLEGRNDSMIYLI